MQFDEHGNLFPYALLATHEAQMETHLCNTSARRALFANFRRYNVALADVINSEFTQYVGGSFLSLHGEPADIDVANLIALPDPDDAFIERLLPLLTLGGSHETYRVDGHLIPVYAPEDVRFQTHWPELRIFGSGLGRTGRVGQEVC